MKKLDELTRDDRIACIKNWVEELHQEAHQLIDEKTLTDHLNKENIAYRKSISELRDENEKLKSSKSLSEEEINKLVNDKIASIFRNPLTYLMSLPIIERNELIGRIYTAIIGVRFN